ncbi:MAG TPA: insulinase family protein [Gemmatimonadaceae bacterium]|nr:insulinase family protein [Gemmatimonadaceae bacterium]
MLRPILAGAVLPLLALSLSSPAPAAAQRPATGSAPSPEAAAPATAPARLDSAALARVLPMDPQVTIGTLPNGLRYYIRENRKPEKRAELRLVVRAGSILEDDDQRGLAHVLEHMAFNGTTHFARNELVSWLERAGMQFGPDINAYTSFDETVYMLQLPTDSARILRTGFEILDDWARHQTLDTAEIAKERGVVVEEWRLGRGAASRMRDEQLPILLKGSRYAERLPIGTKESLDHFAPAALARFYRDWYRPDLMAVVAVGDFDGKQIERVIREQFGDIPAAKNPRPRVTYDIPDHDSTLFAIATDREATGSSVAVYFKQPERRDSTVGDYREELVEQLYNRMLNQRLFELTQSPNAPFLGASSSQGSFVGPKEVYVLAASVKDGGITRGLEALLTEAERVERFGFTATELERQKQQLLRGMERDYAEREKTESSVYAEEYAAHYLEEEPVPGIAFEYALAKQLVPGIALEEVNRLARAWITDRNRVIAVNAPDKPGVPVPTTRELLAVFDSVRGKTITAYRDAAPDAPLVARAPAPGTILTARETKDLGVTEWRLSNGARVILKPTTFRDDEVLFRAFSPGGTSLLPDSDFTAARSATAVVGRSGLGTMSRIELQKALAGKAASVAPVIGELEEGLAGQASPKDLETLFQLIYLNFTAPRADSAAVLALKQQQKAALENRSASPDAAFVDTLVATLTQHHPRTRPPSAARIDSIDVRKSLAFYRDRFADASDFTFVFVGSFSVDSMRPLVLRYIGGLPATGRRETWRDVGIEPPAGVVRREVRKGTEPKAQTQLVFTGPFEWTPENRYALESLAGVLRIRLRESLREGMGGTYGVSVGATPARWPKPGYQLGIGFGSSPERAEQLTQAVFAVIDSLRTQGATADEVAKVREMQHREQETGLEENGYWLSTLVFASRYGEDPHALVRTDALQARLTPALVRDAARRYLNERNYVLVRLLPQQ